MFDAPQKTHETTWQDRLTELLPRLLQLPLYRSRLENPAQPPSAAAFTQLPFITKRELREGFPGNFLGTERILQTLLDSKEVELEHTSGTSGERLPVLLGRGWWEMQELRAIQLNPRLALSFAPGLTPRRAALTPAHPTTAAVRAQGRCYVGKDGHRDRRMLPLWRGVGHRARLPQHVRQRRDV